MTPSTTASPSAFRLKACRGFPSLVLIALLAGGANPLYAADTIKGGQLYASHCAACHGPSGISVMPGAPNFARQERLLQPDAALLASIKAGRNAMPAFQGVLSDRDISDVIAFLRTLR